MLGILTNLLKYSKAIGVVAIVIAVASGGWYFSSLISENQHLENQLDRFESANEELEQTLSRQKQKYESELNAVTTSMETYMHSLAMSKDTNNLLVKELERVSENDEELQKCLNMPLPDSAVGRLRQ